MNRGVYKHLLQITNMIKQLSYISYTQNNWPVKYLAKRSKIAVGVTLIWRKAVAVSKHNSYRPEMALFNFGRLKIIRQTAKLNTSPIILRIRYVWLTAEITV